MRYNLVLIVEGSIMPDMNKTDVVTLLIVIRMFYNYQTIACEVFSQKFNMWCKIVVV